MHTQAAYIKAPWQVSLREVDLPDSPPPGWIRLRVDACGICGSDLNAARAEAADWQPFGHEVAGTVETVGHGVDRVEPGQRVVLESGSFCGRCALCRDGRVDLCNKAPGFWGQPAMGFARTMDAPALAAVPYDGLLPQVACLAEPTGVAIDVLETAEVELGQRVCVIGPGPIGLMAAALALARGASGVVVVGRGRSQARLELAGRLGTEVLAIDGDLADRDDLARQFDHVLLCAPPELAEPCLALLGYGGRLTYIGVATRPTRIGFDANDFHFRKLQIRASFASPALYFPTALRLLAAGRIPGENLVSHVLPLERLGEAMSLHRDEPGRCVKVVIVPD
ncbi:MAG: zinc-dependent alcohol dehydrogenase [Planctomycetota bacterium]